MIYFLSFIFTTCMLYYIYYIYHVINAPSPLPQANFLIVSVVVAARNEGLNIKNCLLSLIAQDYPKEKYEIIIVDDFSEDNTAEIVLDFQRNYPNIRLISLSENSGKKAAIALAISEASGEIILQTDADCMAKPTWINGIMAYFTDNTALVSAPVQLIANDNKMFSQLQIWEFMGLNLLGGGAMNQGKPNMCNGANLAFRKAVFEEVNGFEGINQVASGDDELLLQKIDALKKYDIRYAFSQDVIIQTPVQETFRQFWQQRVRWVSKARAYQNRMINVTQLLFFFAILGIPTVFCMGFYDKYLFLLGLFLLGVKAFFDYFLMKKACNFFNIPFHCFYFLLLEISYIPYVISIGVVGNFTQNYIWKGRKVR